MATVKELKAQAKAKGIKGYSTMKKAELEKALGGGEAKPPPKPPRLKTKAQQAMNPVKQVQPPKKKVIKVKKAPAAKIDKSLLTRARAVVRAYGNKDEMFISKDNTKIHYGYDDLERKGHPLTEENVSDFEKRFLKKKAPVKKAPAATTKDSADMKFIKNMKNTVKDIKRLYSIFRKYGDAIPKLKWKNFSATSKLVEFDAPHGYAFNLEKIAERVREGRDLKGKGMLDANDWFNVFAGFKPTHGTFSFEKLLANKAPAKKAPEPAKKAPAPKKKKMKLKTKAELIEDINDDEREDGMSSMEYVDHKNDYRNNYPTVAKTDKQMEKLDDYAYKQINNQIYAHYKANAGKKFPLRNFKVSYVYGKAF